MGFMLKELISWIITLEKLTVVYLVKIFPVSNETRSFIYIQHFSSFVRLFVSFIPEMFITKKETKRGTRSRLC